MPAFVYTIGHSNHPIKKFIELLTAHNVTAVADVRSHPYSRFNPQFNQERLRGELETAGMVYAFLGRELGARSADPNCYVNGKVQYELLAGTPLFREGLSRVVQGTKIHRMTLMCAEKDPLTCHRTILVCRHLGNLGIGAQHILEDGRIESHDAALSRLLDELGLEGNDLFRSREEVILEAYDRRGKQIAHRLPLGDDDPAGRVEG